MSATKQGVSSRRKTSVGAQKPRRVRPIHEPFTADELRRISQEISQKAWPVRASNRLELMEIDPWNVYAYWHIRASDLAKCRARLIRKGLNPQLVLRFYDVSSKHSQNGLHDSFDIEVTQNSNNWYVNLWRDGKRYSAEIGLRTADGAFEALASSNQIATPRAYPSADLDFYLVNVQTPAMPEPSARVIPRATNDDLLRNLFPQRFLDAGEFPWVDPAGIISASDGEWAFPDLDVPAQETIEGPPDFPVLDRLELEQYGAQASQAREEILAGTHLPALRDTPVEIIAPAAKEFGSRPQIQTLLNPIAGHSQSPAAGIVHFFAESPQEPGILDIRNEAQEHRSVSLEMYLGSYESSSWTTGDALNMSAHLVIEGTCPPDRQLLLFGEQVSVAPDGTFCIKLPLERGPELLEFMVRNNSRKIQE